MIEVYGFFAMFLVQILTISVLHPAWFIRYVRRHAARYPAERFAQFYPGVDLDLARARFLTRYRALNTGIAVLGLLLLGWMFGYMRRAAWSEVPVVVLLSVYSAVQLSPISFVAWSATRFKNKVLKHSLP